MMLCGGSDDVIIPIGLGGFVACRALSERNSDPAKASCSWDSAECLHHLEDTSYCMKLFDIHVDCWKTEIDLLWEKELKSFSVEASLVVLKSREEQNRRMCGVSCK
ncbi:hypothetical protein L1987_64663 [Smallanthus sonchifolius]|uniref:Uncharacterized protein n=1 Tax=Smallanthus sonchifolius TaxID=185202 RepID=A0ACB9BSB1_9ASTR|nr:hypothetical protein L1987_64663 [Smallanthus sonchifolius]